MEGIQYSFIDDVYDTDTTQKIVAQSVQPVQTVFYPVHVPFHIPYNVPTPTPSQTIQEDAKKTFVMTSNADLALPSMWWIVIYMLLIALTAIAIRKKS